MFAGQVGWTPEFYRRLFKRVSLGLVIRVIRQHADRTECLRILLARRLDVYEGALQDDQGLNLWTAYVLSPEYDIAKLPFQWSSGFFYQGPLCRRGEWVFGKYALGERRRAGYRVDSSVGRTERVGWVVTRRAQAAGAGVFRCGRSRGSCISGLDR